MRIAARSSALTTAICLVITILAACTDPSRVSGPRSEPPTVGVMPSKQGPTNSRILYMRGDAIFGGPADIYSMDDDGNDVIQLTFGAGSEFDPAWAPDGKRVLYASNADGPLAIYMMNPDGSGVTRLTTPTAEQFDRDPHALGKRIVFMRFDAADLYQSRWVVNDDGSNLTRLTRGAAARQPAPSPGGKLVAFIRDDDVWVVDVETGALTNLTGTVNRLELMPAWSPSGKQIAFVLEELANQDLYIMNADGTEVTRLTDSQTYMEFAPRWSPDGKRIAFTANYGEAFAVWSMFVDGTGLNNLSQSHTPYVDELPWAWAR